MSTIVEAKAAAEDCELGATPAWGGIDQIGFQRVVPAATGAFPLLWARGADSQRLRDRLAALEAIETVTAIDSQGGSALYRLQLRQETHGVLECLRRSDVFVLTAEGACDGWVFELRFTDHEDLQQFRRHCEDYGVSLEITRLSTDQGCSPRTMPLTEEQREALRTAIALGYFDVPRRTSLEEVGDELGISDQAVSARLRRGIQVLVENVLEQPTLRDDWPTHAGAESGEVDQGLPD